MIICTDLDGTFLGGSEEDRANLYRWIEASGTRLVFVTGRGLESVLQVLSDPTVPTPDFVIGDAGGSVIDGRTLEPVQPLQSQIDQKWPGTHTVLDRLREVSGLVRQDVPQERRCSFLAPPEAVDVVRGLASGIDCDVIYSGGLYLDVVPRGVNKGSTLRALLAREHVDDESVLVAGDTLNDLALFETGYRGVVVGHSEAELVARTRCRRRIYHADRPGAGGIADALVHFDYRVQAQAPEPEPATGSSPLTMLYHRLPYEEYRADGRYRRRPPRSPNGIIPTLLSVFRNGRRGTWIAWAERPSREPAHFAPHVAIDRDQYPGLIASRIPLTRRDVEVFYKVFSKEAFWPIIFNFVSLAKFDTAHWEHFVEINRLFAQRTAEEAAPGGIVWIHDYNLWMVPAHLRLLRPDLRIAFFHHTAFPPPDTFNVIPWRREIVGSLLQCDYLGFHIPRYAENFAQVARSHGPARVLRRAPCAPRFLTFGCGLGLEEYTTALDIGNRVVRLGAHPAGLDVTHLERTLAEPAVQERLASLRRELAGCRAILSVERLDYVKGPLEKLRAFEALLERHPELHGRIMLISVCTPAADGMQVYKSTQDQVDQAVGRINGRFARVGWTPILYFRRALPYQDVLAYCAVSDVAWITPLRDGLNLVAKEYIAAQGPAGHGVLVLSEFAGAAVQLHGALLTNPYHPEDMVATLHRALSMPEAERRARLVRLHAIVARSGTITWSEEFLRAVSADA